MTSTVCAKCFWLSSRVVEGETSITKHMLQCLSYINGLYLVHFNKSNKLFSNGGVIVNILKVDHKMLCVVASYVIT